MSRSSNLPRSASGRCAARGLLIFSPIGDQYSTVQRLQLGTHIPPNEKRPNANISSLIHPTTRSVALSAAIALAISLKSAARAVRFEAFALQALARGRWAAAWQSTCQGW